MRKLTFFFALFFLLVGCSSKRYFEPKEVAGAIRFDGELPAPIIDVLRDGATLKNGNFISRDGLEDYRLPKGYLFINKSDGYYIGADRCKELLIVDASTKEPLFKKKFDRKAPIAGAVSKENGVIALVFDDNSLEAYDLDSKELLYSSKQPSAIAVDTKIANPFFLKGLIIFPTLDGKLIVVAPKKDKKELKTIVVGTKEHFNNIIFLDVIDERLIAATPNKIISISPVYTNALNLDISDVLYLKDRVYIFTKDGKIILATPQLDVLKERKYNFAHFAGAIYGEYLYVIEKGGYIVALDKDLRASNVFKFPTEIEDYIFCTKDKVFYGDKYFTLNRL
ncbi:MAG: hypothetical protein GXO61_00470 [Epsilonproteobacteria bacterium]|nr:hypothetical protein [Campylobacterota bacterium]